MNTTPFWSDTAAIPRFPKLDHDLSVDVVVIGGGITGITAAYLLKKSGATVALLERGRFAGADTGHTTAHLTCVTDLRLRDLVANFGADHAKAAWEAGQAAIEQIHAIVQQEEISCEFSWVPGYLHAPAHGAGADEESKLKEDAKLARDFGFDAAFLDKIPFLHRMGVRFSNQAKFHPRKYLGALLKLIPGKGGHVFQSSAVEKIEEAPLRITANGRTIHCKHIVIATHVPLQGLAGTVSAALFQTKLVPYTSYVVGAKIPRKLVAEASFWDTAEPYQYLRIDHRRAFDYAILGGADHKTGQAADPEQHFQEVEKALTHLIREAQVDHRWSGQVVETTDGLPFIGETAPAQFVATGFSGNGMTFGTVGAMMAADYIHRRKNPWAELFDVNRKKILGGAWDYLKENKDYPYYYIKDRLGIPSSEALHDLQPGEGRIVVHEGEKLAAFRDEKGSLSVKSAICPHMGCVVRWNGAEKTWDCPCHGSRFAAAGKVIAGPAETSLSEAQLQ